MYGNIPGDFAPLRVRQGDGVRAVLADEEGIVLARGHFEGHESLYASEPMLTHGMLRAFFREAGVHLYMPDGCTVYADNRLLSVFTHMDDLDTVLKLPERMTLTDLISGEKYENTAEIPLRLPAKRMRVFRKLT